MAPAENLHSTEPGEFTFRWTIMNLHMFGGLQGKEIVSPKFTVPSLHETEWCMKLVLDEEDIKFVKCFLHRLEDGPENIEINYSLTVGSSYSLELEKFEKNVSSTKPITINIHELGQNQKVEQGVMVEVLIECRLWPRADEFDQSESGRYVLNPVLCLARTLIPCERRTFYYRRNWISEVPVYIIRCASVCPPVVGNSMFFCDIERRVSNRLFTMALTSYESTPFLVNFRIKLVDAHKKHHSLLSNRCIIEKDKSGFDSFSIPELMLEKKDLYLPGYMMHLSCEFDVSRNESIVSFVERTWYDSSDIQSTDIVCGWNVYLEQKYDEHRFLYRLLAVLMIAFSLLIPHLVADNSV